jgi:hypothetical protein
MKREWTREEAFPLASVHCSQCKGGGLRIVKEKLYPCGCVLRAIFRACLSRFIENATAEKWVSRAKLELGAASGQRRYSYGRKDEEYMADFYLISKRTLDEQEFKVFRYYFLLSADWRLCCRKLQMERGVFFHMVYRIEEKLGRVFHELEPYALYPIDEYYLPVVGEHRAAAGAKVVPMRGPVRPPVRGADLREEAA